MNEVETELSAHDDIRKSAHPHTSATIRRPGLTSNRSTPSGCLCGNGDLSLIFDECNDGVCICIAKSDFWKAAQGEKSDGGIKPIARLKIKGGGADYYAEQRMDEAEILCRTGALEVRALACATENTALIEITSTDSVEYDLQACEGSESKNSCGEKDSAIWVSRAFESEELLFKTKAVVCLKKINEIKNDNDNMVVTRLVLAVTTNHDCDNSGEDAFNRTNAADFVLLEQKHADWWSEFWAKSSVKLADKQLELNWYASQYIMVCCMRSEKFPPGLYGNFISSDSVGWHGDYHLNYNYQAPFYALFSSNHVELSDCFAAPLEAFSPQAQKFAQDFLGCRGVYFPVGIGPLGMNTSALDYSLEHGQLFLGQKSNAAYAALILIMRWNATRDLEYAAEHIYPFVSSVGDFWEDYLKFEGGRYVIYNDAAHEVPYYKKDFDPKSKDSHADDFNNLLSLALVRAVFGALLDMAEELGVDGERAEKRRHILEHISEFPTYRKRFRTIFRLTEKGNDFNRTNSLCIQHIYPVGQIGHACDDELLKTARNTYFFNDRRLDDNGSCSYLPCGARLGVDPDYLIDGLKKNIAEFQQPNMLFNHGGGCLEHSSTAASTLNEMMLQGFEGYIRVFPVWSKKDDAEFKNLRADGAFLVSAKIEGGEIGTVQVLSERGRILNVLNPFDCTAKLTDSLGNVLCEADCKRIVTAPTAEGEKYFVSRAE